jgi:hypothetical protein
MRFDARCRDCAFYMSRAPTSTECANTDGKVWDPREKACDNFMKTGKKASSS